MASDPFIERVGGDWRAEAPTHAQIAAHAGRWCLKAPGCTPHYDRLSTGDDLRGGGPFVVSDDEAERVGHVPADEWDGGGGQDWRGRLCLVCPCDGDGLPVAWP